MTKQILSGRTSSEIHRIDCRTATNKPISDSKLTSNAASIPNCPLNGKCRLTRRTVPQIKSRAGNKLRIREKRDGTIDGRAAIIKSTSPTTTKKVLTRERLASIVAGRFEGG